MTTAYPVSWVSSLFTFFRTTTHFRVILSQSILLTMSQQEQVRFLK